MRTKADDTEIMTSGGDTRAGMNPVNRNKDDSNKALGTDGTQAGSSDTPLGQEGGVTGGNTAVGASGTDGDEGQGGETRNYDKKVQG